MRAGTRLAAAVQQRSRRHKLTMLEQLIPVGASVLAVGVANAQSSANVNLIETRLAARRWVVGVSYRPLRPGNPFSTVQADGLRLPFRDGSFDYVFSNAVIEHVGDRPRQERFLAESVRVARVGVVHTTPNRWHPVETHTKTLFLHWLPRTLHTWLFLHLRASIWQPTFRLLSARELRALFPGAAADVHGWPRRLPISLLAVAPAQPAVRETQTRERRSAEAL